MDEKKSYPFHEIFFKKEWSYTTGAVLLATLATVLLIVTSKPWGITGAFAMWGGSVLNAIGFDVDTWSGFQKHSIAKFSFWQDQTSVLDIAIILGALLAVLLAGQFKVKKIKSWRNIAAAVCGGLLMGIGARFATGCNIGAFLSALPAFSLSGYIFMVSMFVGAFTGSLLLKKYFM